MVLHRNPPEVTARELCIAVVEEGRPALVLTFFKDDIDSIPENVYYTVSVTRHEFPLTLTLDEAHVVGVTV